MRTGWFCAIKSYNTRKSRLSTYQRAGFLLSQFNDGLGLSDNFSSIARKGLAVMCATCRLMKIVMPSITNGRFAFQNH